MTGPCFAWDVIRKGEPAPYDGVIATAEEARVQVAYVEVLEEENEMLWALSWQTDLSLEELAASINGIEENLDEIPGAVRKEKAVSIWKAVLITGGVVLLVAAVCD